MNKLSAKWLYLINSIFQIAVASIVSAFQVRNIKKNAKQTKYVQLGFALLIFIISLGQTAYLRKLIKSD